jgi:acetyl-CoA acyltransferase
VPDPIGKVKGALAGVRPDHLAADAITALIGRNPGLDVAEIDDVYWGAANQAGEDNRNVARMAVLLAGLPAEIPGATVNRLCGSGMEAVCDAARAIAVGEADVCLAGGSESMTRAPFMVARSEDPFPRGLDLARHQARLTAGQPADAGDVPADHARRDRRERGGQVRHQPGAPGRVGAAQPPARRRRPRRQPV